MKSRGLQVRNLARTVSTTHSQSAVPAPLARGSRLRTHCHQQCCRLERHRPWQAIRKAGRIPPSRRACPLAAPAQTSISMPLHGQQTPTRRGSSTPQWRLLQFQCSSLSSPAGFASRSACAPLALPAVARRWGACAAGRPRLVFTLPPNHPLHRMRPDGRPGELRRSCSS